MSVLPPRLERLLVPDDKAAAAAVNRALIFDRTPEPRTKEWKRDFFSDFATAFKQHEGEYDAFIGRRSEALSRIGGLSIDIRSTSRLIVGHGIPHSTQIGFLFDRLRGVPYLPGSTVKGLLRETARLIATGEIAAEADVADLAARAEEIFGTQERRGAVVCWDAFVMTWPRLEVDVMTPHHQSYYENGTAPGDWESPVPVYFLTIAPDQQFRFWFLGSGTGIDLAAIEKLLRLGLEWLGVGGKKSSGYGRFWPLDAHGPPPERPTPPTQASPPPVTVWPDAQLTFTPNDGYVTARWQGKTARAKNQTLPDWFRKKKTGKAAVTVEGFTILSIDWPPK
ncbi:MAG: type III-B CRISPR module RAMP protein Cmr6 [Thermoanaerobaculia bacterium]